MNKKVNQPDINDHYTNISSSIGTTWSSTMLDREIREKEIDNLIKLIYHISSQKNLLNLKILDIGCGNGYVISRLHCEFPLLTIDGVDINSGMIELAESRLLPRTRFLQASCTDLEKISIDANTYDLVYSTRCFINVMEENQRYDSIKLASNYVKVNGYLGLMEGFEDGQVAYNLLREALGFQVIPPAWHNIYLDSLKISNILANDFNNCSEAQMNTIGLDKHFLSNRYLAMRVLLPLFKNDPDFFDKNRNDPSGLALSYLLPKTIGFSPLQLHLWQKLH
jgi:ubiquinone/menaquinone biosynthesis C-methylase UbiE